MIESDFEVFTECWMQACSGIGKDPTASQIEWAFEVLKDKELLDIKKALIMNARNPKSGQFHPKPADIIREMEGTDEDKKAKATAAFSRLVDSVNRYESVIFDDPAIHYAFSIAFLGDWITACDYDPQVFLCQQQKRDFEKAYASYKQGMPYPPRMIGITERENNDIGYEYTGTIYIGLKDECLAVERNSISSRMKKISTETLAIK